MVVGMRETYVLRGGKLVPKSEAQPLEQRAGIYVISDTMEPAMHMASCRVLDSKSEFRKDTRAHGCIEIGNESPGSTRIPVTLDRRERRQEIAKAIYDLRNGRA